MLFQKRETRKKTKNAKEKNILIEKAEKEERNNFESANVSAAENIVNCKPNFIKF